MVPLSVSPPSRQLLVCFLPEDFPLLGMSHEQSLMVYGLLHLTSVAECDVRPVGPLSGGSQEGFILLD